MAFEQNVEHEKTPARAGSLNPTGEFKMTAQFDDTGRYLALHSGFQTAFDLDARNVNPENAADVFKHFTEEFAMRDRVTAGTPQMMLYGREMPGAGIAGNGRRSARHSTPACA